MVFNDVILRFKIWSDCVEDVVERRMGVVVFFMEVEDGVGF